LRMAPCSPAYRDTLHRQITGFPENRVKRDGESAWDSSCPTSVCPMRATSCRRPHTARTPALCQPYNERMPSVHMSGRCRAESTHGSSCAT
jgi:hypothetical protein